MRSGTSLAPSPPGPAPAGAGGSGSERDLLEIGIEANPGSPRALIFPGDVWAPDAVRPLSAALTPTGVAYADEDELPADGTRRGARGSSPTSRPSSS